MRKSFLAVPLLCAAMAASCDTAADGRRAPSPVFVGGDAPAAVSERYDLDMIQESGQIIAGTLSGRDTYYEYRGLPMGTQYAMALEFARSIGVRLRVELESDTAALTARLERGEIDIVLLGTPRWLTRADAPKLREAIDRWWDPARGDSLERRAAEEALRRTAGRRPQPVAKDLEHGIISQYDDLFRRYARGLGWDWRLLAAQCYQESGFDAKAVSWVGAQGLMQIMPSTAARLGMAGTDVWDPEKNISMACRYISELQASFADVADGRQRLRFVLAAYNGGANHIRDAMALTAVHGGRQQVWDDVEPYVRLLSEPKYYRDPSVRYGYMRGDETASYVSRILARWDSYRTHVRRSGHGATPAPAGRSVRDGEYRSLVRPASEWVGDSL